MKKVISLFFSFFVSIGCIYAATLDNADSNKYSIENYKNKIFIFDGNQQIKECNNVGVLNSPQFIVTAYQGSRFRIVHVDKQTGDMTIRFLTWKLPKKNPTDSVKMASYNLALNNRKIFNVKTEPEKLIEPKNQSNSYVRYFLLTQDDKTNSCSEFVTGQNWDINLGTFTSPFKFRPSKSAWSSNLNLGTSVSVQYKLSTDWSLGTVIGLSVSSVTLDSASTSGLVKTNTDRPALTPSLSILASYKNINITFGSGIDYINRPTAIEQSWIFNSKPWIGFGIGVSLFTNSKTANNTTPIN